MKEMHPKLSTSRPFPRLKAPVYFTKVGLRFFRRRRKAPDDAMGGVRVYTDEDPKEGARLRVEIFLPDGSSVTCTVQVVWVESLPEGALARYDVGLGFVAIYPQDRELLSAVLQQE
jgi:hypothetical protein